MAAWTRSRRRSISGVRQPSETIDGIPLLGIRETRRVKGDYTLTIKDYLQRRTFADEICRNAYPVDVHCSKKETAAFKKGKGAAMDRYNRLKFDPVTTTALRIAVQLQPEWSGGLLQWKVE